MIYLAVMLPLLLINFIPGVGAAVYAVLAWLFTAYFLALEFMDYPLDRRGLSLGAKVAATCGAWGWAGWAIGSAVLVMGLVPVVNFALLPLAAMGGTLLYLERPLGIFLSATCPASPGSAMLRWRHLADLDHLGFGGKIINLCLYSFTGAHEDAFSPRHRLPLQA